MKMKMVILAFLSCGLVACATSSNQYTQSKKQVERPPVVPYQLNEQQIEAAKEMVRQNLKDPESARFSDIFGITQAGMEEGYAVCGKVNAKNAFGGYAGSQPFSVKGRFVTIGSNTVDALMVRYTCTGGI